MGLTIEEKNLILNKMKIAFSQNFMIDFKIKVKELVKISFQLKSILTQMQEFALKDEQLK